MTIRLKQGTVMPTPGIGLGYILLLTFILLIWHFGAHEIIIGTPESLMLPLIFLLMQFTYKDILVDSQSPHEYKVQYRFFILPFLSYRKQWADYSVFVLKMHSVQYNVPQMAGSGMQSNTSHESSLAILGNHKITKKVILICKGRRSELNEVIKSCIYPSGIPIYRGAPKKGYEYLID